MKKTITLIALVLGLLFGGVENEMKSSDELQPGPFENGNAEVIL